MPLIRRGPPEDSKAVPTEPLARLRAGDTEERWAAARALAGHEEAVDALAQALHAEGDRGVREAIFTSLAQTAGPASARAIVRCLRSDDAALRTAALDTLRVMPAALATYLPGLLADADADVRVLACDLARHLPAEISTPMLNARLGHEPEPNVCAAAVDVLAEQGDSESLAALDACGARFAGSAFLSFAIRVARQRIGAKASEPRG